MAAVVIRNLSDEVHRALKARAEQHGNSTEAEIRAILEAAVLPPQRLQVGSILADFGRRFAVTNEFDVVREPTPPEPGVFD